MFSSAALSRRLAWAACFAISGLTGRAQLAGASPFLPPQNANVSAPTQNAPLEYRGLIATPDGVQYRIYDPARKTGVWVKLNERNPDFGVVVKQYDADRGTVTVEHDGRTLTLEERKAKIVSSGPASGVVPPVMQTMPGVLTPGIQAVVPNSTPADEQKRLEAVAQEVARRRALREQTTTQVNPGAIPAMGVPAVQPIQPIQRPQVMPQNQNVPNGRRGQVNRQSR